MERQEFKKACQRPVGEPQDKSDGGQQLTLPLKDTCYVDEDIADKHIAELKAALADYLEHSEVAQDNKLLGTWKEVVASLQVIPEVEHKFFRRVSYVGLASDWHKIGLDFSRCLIRELDRSS